MSLKVVPLFWGAYLEFYKVIPKRNYFGAWAYRGDKLRGVGLRLKRVWGLGLRRSGFRVGVERVRVVRSRSGI